VVALRLRLSSRFACRRPPRRRGSSTALPPLGSRSARAFRTSEDAAFILAHGKGADLIVAVGSHGNLREFLDKGRQGMASTFLVRLRVGEILVDAKGVSRLYRGRIRGRDAILLLVAALVAIAVIVAVSPPLRLYVKLLYESLRNFVFRITH